MLQLFIFIRFQNKFYGKMLSFIILCVLIYLSSFKRFAYLLKYINISLVINILGDHILICSAHYILRVLEKAIKEIKMKRVQLSFEVRH